MFDYKPKSTEKKPAAKGEEPPPAVKHAIHLLTQTTEYPYLDKGKDLTFPDFIEYMGAMREELKLVTECAMYLHNKSVKDSDYCYGEKIRPDDDPLITVKEACDILGKVDKTIYNYVKKGYLSRHESKTGELRLRLSEVRNFYKKV